MPKRTKLLLDIGMHGHASHELETTKGKIDLDLRDLSFQLCAAEADELHALIRKRYAQFPRD